MKRTRHNNRGRRAPRRRSRYQEVVDTINLRVAAGQTVAYSQSDLPVSVVNRAYRVRRVCAYVTASNSGMVAQLELRAPSYESGQNTIATSGTVSVGVIPQRIFVNAPANVNMVPAGRAGDTKLFTIDALCLEKSSSAILFGTLRVYIQVGNEFLGEQCPKIMKVISPDEDPDDLASTSSAFDHLSL